MLSIAPNHCSAMRLAMIVQCPSRHLALQRNFMLHSDWSSFRPWALWILNDYMGKDRSLGSPINPILFLTDHVKVCRQGRCGEVRNMLPVLIWPRWYMRAVENGPPANIFATIGRTEERFNITGYYCFKRSTGPLIYTRIHHRGLALYSRTIIDFLNYTLK